MNSTETENVQDISMRVQVDRASEQARTFVTNTLQGNPSLIELHSAAILMNESEEKWNSLNESLCRDPAMPKRDEFEPDGGRPIQDANWAQWADRTGVADLDWLSDELIEIAAPLHEALEKYPCKTVRDIKIKAQYMLEIHPGDIPRDILKSFLSVPPGEDESISGLEASNSEEKIH